MYVIMLIRQKNSGKYADMAKQTQAFVNTFMNTVIHALIIIT